MSISLDEFVRSLTDTGILPLDEVTSMVSSLPDDRKGVDVEKLAKDLIRQQKLTRFQASVIFKRQSRGLRFGDYIVLDKIGSGGIGQVFKAENRRTGQLVALKLLRATFTKSERAVARFYREADTAARLKHRNLISVVDAGETNGLHFLVMELVEGRDVRSLVKEKGPLPVATAIDIIMQAAQGLECAHQNGVIHRDIKPANLLLQNNGRVVVLDLGLARLDDPVDESEGEDNQRLTMPGHFLGTLDYVSPEQTADAHEVTARSDVYSLGCTLYYLLTGQPPYRRDNAALILFAHCQDPIPKLAGDAPGVSERLEELFQRMMAKKAADRVATMTEVIAELEACRHELAGGNPSSGAKRAARPVVAARAAASSEPSEIAPEIREERTIELPPVSDDEDEVDVDSPATTTTPDSLAGTFREIAESDFAEVSPLAPSRRRRKSRVGWTIALAGLAIGSLAVGGWIAARGWPSWLR
jgi:serine/threonine protein kinase